jgi:hypothetical protein
MSVIFDILGGFLVLGLAFLAVLGLAWVGQKVLDSERPRDS